MQRERGINTERGRETKRQRDKQIESYGVREPGEATLTRVATVADVTYHLDPS